MNRFLGMNYEFGKKKTSAKANRPPRAREIADQITGHFTIWRSNIRRRHHQVAGRIRTANQHKLGEMVSGEMARRRAGGH
jgi:hypothetical protein